MRGSRTGAHNHTPSDTWRGRAGQPDRTDRAQCLAVAHLALPFGVLVCLRAWWCCSVVIGSSRRYDTLLELSLSLAAAPPSSDSEVKLTLLVRCPQTAPAKGGVFLRIHFVSRLGQGWGWGQEFGRRGSTGCNADLNNHAARNAEACSK